MSASGSRRLGITGVLGYEYPNHHPRSAVESGLASVEGWKEPWLMHVDFLGSFTITT